MPTVHITPLPTGEGQEPRSGEGVGLHLHVKTFSQLTTTELYDLLHVRSAVFVVEQNCVYQDIDYNDQTAIHLWLTDARGKIVALSRICPGGTKLPHLSIGRVISTVRGKGYGALIFQKALDVARERFPDVRLIQIEAQLTKQHFYERFGFRTTSEPFMMEGLLHIDMELRVE